MPLSNSHGDLSPEGRLKAGPRKNSPGTVHARPQHIYGGIHGRRTRHTKAAGLLFSVCITLCSSISHKSSRSR